MLVLRLGLDLGLDSVGQMLSCYTPVAITYTTALQVQVWLWRYLFTYVDFACCLILHTETLTQHKRRKMMYIVRWRPVQNLILISRVLGLGLEIRVLANSLVLALAKSMLTSLRFSTRFWHFVTVLLILGSKMSIKQRTYMKLRLRIPFNMGGVEWHLSGLSRMTSSTLATYATGWQCRSYLASPTQRHDPCLWRPHRQQISDWRHFVPAGAMTLLFAISLTRDTTHDRIQESKKHIWRDGISRYVTSCCHLKLPTDARLPSTSTTDSAFSILWETDNLSAYLIGSHDCP